uniref:energy transducer TonB n=1 Tax=Microbulbifer agarilyticus TaxID=260552 RepID=UPI00130359EA|nr:energy transducer TonB [Microbulbifer agarilyticus]
MAASQALALDWQRPDCASFAQESACINDYKNQVRRDRQQEFRAAGVQFWYYERPDFSENAKVEKALADKLEGALLVSFDIEKDGSVSAVALRDQTSEDMLVYAGPVLDAVRNWQFVPMEEAVSGRTWLFPFIFKTEACGEVKDSAACAEEENSSHQGAISNGVTKGAGGSPEIYTPRWSGPFYDLFFIHSS